MEAREKRQSLLVDLLGSIKKCQVRYGGKSELATENEDVVADLCSKFEAVFNHGLITNEPLTLRHVTDIVANNIQGLPPTNNFVRSKSAWRVVAGHLNRHELERYTLLRSVNTDQGRFRAWLRSSLNEHSLERYLHMLLADTARLAESYECWAFVMDQERGSMLPNMAAGLQSILFAITIDNELLNFWPTVRDDDPATTDELVARAKTEAAAGKGKRRQRKSASQVISFDNKPDCGITTRDNTWDLEHRLQQLKEQQDSMNEASGNSSTIMEDGNDVENEDEAKTPDITFEKARLDNNTVANEDEVDVLSTNSLTPTKGADGLSQSSIDIKLTPMKNVEVGALIPVELDEVTSEDSISVKSLGDDQDYASAMSSLITTPQPHYRKRGANASSSVCSVASGDKNSTLSLEDLKTALLSVSERKEELQEQCSALKKLLERESAASACVKHEAAELERKSREAADKANARLTSLSRENELLKHQLKKYVGAVQKLRDGPQAHETLAQLEGQSKKNQDGSKYVDYHYEASEYEKKLIQVAEMHGELLEFNEHLQRVLQQKDNWIRRLRQELTDLRGPLPDEVLDEMDDRSDVDNADTLSFVSDADSSAAFGRRTLINIWIPSVFLSGTGNSTHHVYQVYLRIRDEEWNIYRRYSEFYGLYKDLLKRERDKVAHFDFPPKKTVGNKAEKFVEDRRKRLQAYLRNIVNLMVKTNPALLAKPDKEQVILLMPFFTENAHQRHNSYANAGQPAHQRPSIFQRRRTGAETTTQLAL